MIPETPSFIRNAPTKREIILGLLHGRINGKILAGLKTFDDFVNYFETLVNLGTQVSVSGVAGRVQVTNAELKEHLGDDLFGEMERISKEGRAFLSGLGYQSTAKVAPSVLLGPDSTSATGVVQSFQVENPGEPPLSGIKVTPFGSDNPA